jgi:protein TonB
MRSWTYKHLHEKRIANGEQGTATVAFRIDRRGRLLESRIVHGSGSAALDEETLALVRRAQPFPAPPANISDVQLSFVLPMNYIRPRQFWGNRAR